LLATEKEMKKSGKGILSNGKTVVLATGNSGKLCELQAYFNDQTIVFKAQDEFGVQAVAETGTTFIENAIIKARHASEKTGLPALADDSGLMVSALHGAPGVHSARYAGVNATDAERIEKLLHELEKSGDSDRSACFCCALAYFRFAADPAPVIAFGQWWGFILNEPIGVHGFGYDPIFWVPTHLCSAAQLNALEKNRISHRGIAMQRLLNDIK
jgi:XTP/dITP diphosphohydrolase